MKANLQTSKELTAAASAAAEDFARGTSLAGVGSEVWRQLWESARRYSTQRAYPEQSFPVTDDAVCVLCQQSIDDDAAQRLAEFERFIKGDIQSRARKAEEAVTADAKELNKLRIPAARPLLKESTLLGTEAARAVRSFLVKMRLRRRTVVRALRTGSWADVGVSPEPPDCKKSKVEAEKELQVHRRAARSEERKAMESRLKDLTDREKLAEHRMVVLKQLDRLAGKRILDRAIQSCDTSVITRKRGDVAEIVITSQLRNHFSKNLRSLAFAAGPSVDMKRGRGTAGQHPYQVALLARDDVAPDDVLSEGERSCVALAGLLAELEVAGDRSGIVLDDPVSSLDHKHRRHVARRLAEEAQARQVVVFTHDVVFLLMLTKAARTAGVPVCERTVHRVARHCGVAEDGPPWDAMSVEKCLGVLRNELQTAAAAQRKGDRATYEQKAEWIYGRLRKSWERAVEQRLLSEVVVRFGDGVSTQMLRHLTDIEDADVQLVDAEMSRCSGFMHDESGAVNAGVPEPETIGEDIAKLDDWIKAIKDRRKQKKGR